MIDLGCQVNLARGSTLPHFYWEKISTQGVAIEGTIVPITAKAELFPVQFNKVSDKLTLYRLDDISDDCVLGSEFLHRVSPFAVDTKKITFSCIFNNQTVTLPISFQSSPKCLIPVKEPIDKPKPAQLLKMDRCVSFSEAHKEKTLKDISEKLVKDCCSDSPNAFWTREKYFISLPYDHQ